MPPYSPLDFWCRAEFYAKKVYEKPTTAVKESLVEGERMKNDEEEEEEEVDFPVRRLPVRKQPPPPLSSIQNHCECLERIKDSFSDSDSESEDGDENSTLIVPPRRVSSRQSTPPPLDASLYRNRPLPPVPEMSAAKAVADSTEGDMAEKTTDEPINES